MKKIERRSTSNHTRHLKIYEAGAMSGVSFEEQCRWRGILKLKLRQAANMADYRVSVVNPALYYNFEEHRHQSESEIMDYDLKHVETSDIVVVNLDRLNGSDGSKLELFMAWKLGILVIAFGENALYEELHPWIKRMITRVETTDEDVVTYIRDFYMI